MFYGSNVDDPEDIEMSPGNPYTDWNGQTITTTPGNIITADLHSTGTSTSIPINTSMGMAKYEANSELKYDGVDANGDAITLGQQFFVTGYTADDLGLIDYPTNSAGESPTSIPRFPMYHTGAGQLAYFRDADGTTLGGEIEGSNVAAMLAAITPGTTPNLLPKGVYFKTESNGIPGIAFSTTYNEDEEGTGNFINDIIPAHNHDHIEYVSGSGLSAVYNDGYMPYDLSLTRVTGTLLVEPEQYVTTFTATDSKEWNIYNLNRESGDEGDQYDPVAGSPLADQANVSQTWDWNALNTALTGAGENGNSMVEQYYTGVVIDTNTASFNEHISGIAGLSAAHASNPTSYSFDPDGASGYTAVTAADTDKIFTFGNYMFINVTDMITDHAGYGSHSAAHKASNDHWKITNPYYLQHAVHAGNVTVTGNLSMHMQYNFVDNNDITEVANTVNLINFDADDVVGNGGVSDGAGGYETDEACLAVECEQGFSVPCDSYVINSLTISSYDNDCVVDELEDMLLMWSHSGGQSGEVTEGFGIGGGYAWAYDAVGFDVDWEAGNANPLLLDINAGMDGSSFDNEALKAFMYYDTNTGLCDNSSFDPEVFSALNDLPRIMMMSMPGSLWNAPGTDVEGGISGTDGIHDKILIRMPDPEEADRAGV